MKKLLTILIISPAFILSVSLLGFLFRIPFVQASGLTVTVSGTTATQAILSYTAPNSNPCTVQVSESNTLTPLVHDVDPTLFPGSNLDTRPGAITNGNTRIFVVGKRTSDLASDGRLYSRALQTDTTHYYQVTCGSQVGTGSFQTMDLPLGDTYPESPPFNSNGYGNYAWPSMDWTNKSTTYIDPLTGIQITRATGGENAGGILSAQSFYSDGYSDLNGAWTSPGNAAAGNTSVLASTATNNAPLFLAINNSDWHTGDMLDLGVHVFGDGSSATASNRQVNVCLSIDSGQTCYTPNQTITLPQTTAADEGVYPSAFPTPGFGDWSDKTIPLQEILPELVGNNFAPPSYGTANISNGVMTYVNTGGTPFSPDWVPGTKIWIQGSNPTCAHNLCTISSVQNAEQVTLRENVTLSSVTWQGQAFGIRVTKAGGSGTVAVSFNYNYAWAQQNVPWTDNYNCSTQPVNTSVDANGNSLGYSVAGYLCTIVDAGGQGGEDLYWVGNDGEVRLISLFVIPPSIPGLPASDQVYGTISTIPRVGFDATQGNVMYAAEPAATGQESIYKLTYNGNYQAFNNHYATHSGLDIPYTNDNITWTNITPPSQGMDVATQVSQAYPNYDMTDFGQPTQFAGVADNKALFISLLGGQDGACWGFVFNVTTGKLLTGFDSWDGGLNSAIRWAGCHSIYPQDDFFVFSAHDLRQGGGNFGGPYLSLVTTVQKGGVSSTDTSVAPTSDGSYDATCPAGLDPAYTTTGATGNNCITLTVAGEPCSLNPGSVELAHSSCPTNPSEGFLQNMQVGDYVHDLNTPFPIDNEAMRIVSMTVNSTTSISLVLQRILNNSNYYCGVPINSGPNSQATHLNGWSIEMTTPPNAATCTGGTYAFNVAPDAEFYTEGVWSRGHDQIQEVSPGVYRGFDSGISLAAGNLSLVGGNSTYSQNTTPGFAGAVGIVPNAMQSYPIASQINAPTPETVWRMDNHHLQAYGSFTNQLQAGTNNVYQVNYNTATINYKTIPFVVYAGPNLLADDSNPVQGNSLTDANLWHFCFAYKAGECRTGSSQGNLYVVVPQAEAMNGAACPEGNNLTNTICAFGGSVAAANITQSDMTQNDSTGADGRSLSYGFSGPGRQFIYASVYPTRTGQYALFPGYELDGYRTEALLAKIPPFPNHDSIDRTTFIPTVLNLTPPTGKSITNAIVRFGYVENGSSTNYYCTGRQESCVAAQANGYTNYYFQNSDSYSGVPCSTSCSVTLPTIPQRVTYYEVDYRNANNVAVSYATGVTAELAVASAGITGQTAPVISSIATSSLTAAGVTITWTTDQAANTQVQYGLTNAYGSSSVLADVSGVTAHSVILSGLAASTTYHYAVQSSNLSNNLTVSSDQTFKTIAAAAASSSSGGTGGNTNSGQTGSSSGSNPNTSTLTSTTTSQISPAPPIYTGTSTISGSGASSSQSLLQSLIAELDALLAQLNNLLIGSFTRNLSLGSKGQDVQNLQIFLNDNGYPVATSGAGSPGNEDMYFGPKTSAALAKFQAGHQLGATGIFGATTRAFLESMASGTSVSTLPSVPTTATPPTTPTAIAPAPATTSASTQARLTLGDTGASVTALQQALIQDGYLSPNSAAPGQFDPATLRAVEAFQCIQKIVCSGTPNTTGYGAAGPKTWAKL